MPWKCYANPLLSQKDKNKDLLLLRCGEGNSWPRIKRCKVERAFMLKFSLLEKLGEE